MKFLSILLGGVALLATMTGTFAATPSTNAPPATSAQPGLKLDDYLNDLALTLKLGDDEKKHIEGCYQSDGNLLKNILNNDSLPPVQKAQQVSDLRDARNAKIEALLHDIDRQQAFLKIEARYRVALTELAADGGLIPAQPLVFAPAPPAK